MSKHSRNREKRLQDQALQREGYDMAVEVMKSIHQQLILNVIELKEMQHGEEVTSATEAAARGVGLALRGVQALQPGLSKEMSHDYWLSYLDQMTELIPEPGRTALIEARNKPNEETNEDA